MAVPLAHRGATRIYAAFSSVDAVRQGFVFIHGFCGAHCIKPVEFDRVIG
jgi:hypothetical protein